MTKWEDGFCEHNSELPASRNSGNFVTNIEIVQFSRGLCSLELRGRIVCIIYYSSICIVELLSRVSLYQHHLPNVFFNDVDNYLRSIFFSMAQRPPLGQGLLIIQASRSHADTPRSAGHFGQVIGPTQRPLPENTQHP